MPVVVDNVFSAGQQENLGFGKAFVRHHRPPALLREALHIVGDNAVVSSGKPFSNPFGQLCMEAILFQFQAGLGNLLSVLLPLLAANTFVLKVHPQQVDAFRLCGVSTVETFEAANGAIDDAICGSHIDGHHVPRSNYQLQTVLQPASF
ncbi:hypothetical protein TYRP_010248 [Tyrophagus putrescentiae]|nr:hypothetical protein TYRP_010248 [Tyrophagus putrescentiae]